MADELERPGEGERHGAEHHLPSPTIWPFGFAAGVAIVLIGLILASWAVVGVGSAIAIALGFLWVREATREVRGAPPPPPEPEPAVAEPEEDEEVARYPRNVFLEGATLGVGALIGAAVTLPSLGFMIGPAFIGQEYHEVDLGPLENYPEGQWLVTTFIARAEEGDVGRRTAYVRNNGMANEVPSFTIVSNRCVHLGCPVQPQGPQDADAKKEVETAEGQKVILIPTQPSGFGCPCHGGAYDTEGNRTAGPPVRALDRYRYSIKEGRLVLGTPYSVSEVTGTGADAKIEAYGLADPGQHVDGPQEYLYPYIP